MKSEDDYLDEIFSLAEKVQGLTYGAQGFDANRDLATGEQWRCQRDEALEDLIVASQRLRAEKLVNDPERLQ